MAQTSASSDFREKIIIALLGFILTGVLGGMVTTWIQQRGWAWQNRVATIDKDVQNTLAAYQAASELINTRWHATLRMTRALEQGATDEEWKSARAEYDSADRSWAIRFTNVARDVGFYVDGPFGIDETEQLKFIWPFNCDTYAFGQGGMGGLSGDSARVVLELINHCNGVTKDALDNAALTPDGSPPALDAEARKALTQRAYPRLDAIYRTNEALRCIMLQRAQAIRQSGAADSYWSSFFGVGAPTYKPAPDPGKCLI